LGAIWVGQTQDAGRCDLRREKQTGAQARTASTEMQARQGALRRRISR